MPLTPSLHTPFIAVGGFLRAIWHLARRTFTLWTDREGARLGAAIAFYSIFSLTPLLMVAILIAGMVLGAESAREQLLEQLTEMIGANGARGISDLIDAARMSDRGRTAGMVSLATLLVGATGVFAELRNAIDVMHGTQPASGLGWLVRARLWSFALVLGVGFLMLVSLILSALVAAMGDYMTARFPVLGFVALTLNAVLPLVILGALFALLMRWLPTRRLSWRRVWRGAVLASVLFQAGKEVLGWYLGRAAFAGAFGAAGSLVIVVMWIYYSAQVFLIGVAFNEAWSARQGQPV